MVKLQVGDSVKVRSPKPEWRDIHPNFIEKMDTFVGQMFKVARIYGTNVYLERIIDGTQRYREGTPEIASLQWRPEWLQLASNSTVQNGDAL